MAYFNHAFTKMFLGTGSTLPNPAVTPISITTDKGFITQVGVPTGGDQTTDVALANLPAGYFGFFDPKTYQSVNVTSFPLPTTCCPLILASSSLLTNDKIGPFHGGYKETNKSKVINPKYVQAAYKVTSCVPQQSVITIGNAGVSSGNGIKLAAIAPANITAGTATFVPGTYTNVLLTGGGTLGADAAATVVVGGGGTVSSVTITSSGHGYAVGNILTLSQSAVATPGNLTIAGAGTATTITVVLGTIVPAPNTFQGGTTSAECLKDFLCGETYYLRIDIKGSPALRFLNHNAYQTVSAYTGCCTGTVPTAVDSTLVMIEWAKAIVINNYLKDLVLPVVNDELGNPWYAPGTTIDPITGLAVRTVVNPSTGLTVPATWDLYELYFSPGHTAGATAGLRLFGAYVETKFGNCSFQITDFFEKEPVRLYASLVDYNGDPCVFENFCVYNDCFGIQGMGFGEQVVRDLILAESYLQNFFHTDIRVREITQGNDILNSVNRLTGLYTRYFILHSVPRFNNPTGVFDNDRYMLEIIVSEANPLVPVGNSTLDTFLTNWLGTCANCVSFETRSCTRCTVNVNGVA